MIVARTPIHPGEILVDELKELGFSPTELSRQIRVPANRISQIVNGKRAITGPLVVVEQAPVSGRSQRPYYLQGPASSQKSLGYAPDVSFFIVHLLVVSLVFLGPSAIVLS